MSRIYRCDACGELYEDEPVFFLHIKQENKSDYADSIIKLAMSSTNIYTYQIPELCLSCWHGILKQWLKGDKAIIHLHGK